MKTVILNKRQAIARAHDASIYLTTEHYASENDCPVLIGWTEDGTAAHPDERRTPLDATSRTAAEFVAEQCRLPQNKHLQRDVLVQKFLNYRRAYNQVK